MELVSVLAVLTGEWAWFRLNQWIVERKGLDHRPWSAPSFWGPIGTLCIILAHPRVSVRELLRPPGGLPT